MIEPVVAVIGAKALYFLYAWLIGCMLASTAARLKGYPEKAGLVTGMLLSIFGGIVWMFFPWKRDSRWARATEPTDLVTVAGGFLLAGGAFLPWYENDAGSGQSLLGATLALGLPVALAGALAVAHVLLAASETGPDWVLTKSRMVVMVGGVVALAAVAYGVASPPSDHDSLRIWAYLAVLGGVMTVAGPLLARLRPFPRASQMEHESAPA